jgi:hypothetical protein
MSAPAGTLEQRAEQLKEAYTFVQHYGSQGAPYRATKMKVDPEGGFRELLSWPSGANMLEEALQGLEGVHQLQQLQGGGGVAGKLEGSESGCATGDEGLLGRAGSETGSEGAVVGMAGTGGSSSPKKNVKEVMGSLRR